MNLASTWAVSCARSHHESGRRSPRPVDQADLIDLLRPGVDTKGGHWADLGAGEGAFTRALAELLGPGAHITAVDRDRHALSALSQSMGRRFPQTALEVQVADFTRPLGLNNLDGVVMANSLHFVRDKRPVLQAVMAMLKASGRLILVEYGTGATHGFHTRCLLPPGR